MSRAGSTRIADCESCAAGMEVRETRCGTEFWTCFFLCIYKTQFQFVNFVTLFRSLGSRFLLALRPACFVCDGCEASFKRDRCVQAYTHVCNEELVVGRLRDPSYLFVCMRYWEQRRRISGCCGRPHSRCHRTYRYRCRSLPRLDFLYSPAAFRYVCFLI